MGQTFKLTSKTLIFLAVVWAVFQFSAIRRWDSNLVWQNEMAAYYGYLPALFVLHDISFQKTEMTHEVQERYHFPTPEIRGHVLKTTMGVAILQTPFFLTAHVLAYAGLDHYNGYSEPYRQLIMLSAIFYAIAGLVFIRKTLLHFFSDVATSMVLISLLVGTNLYYYTFYEAGMSHAYSFFLVSVFVWLTVTWHRSRDAWRLVLLGLVIGLITLIRPVNICLALFFAFYKDVSQENLKVKFKQLVSQWKSLLLAKLLFILILLPQFIYWKYISGSWLYNSYGAEQVFFWAKPKIWVGLFSYQKGWLVWTPLMWFAIVGIIFSYKKAQRHFFWAVVIPLSVYIYIIFCWWCWWYGGSFGMRPMVDVLPILAIPLGLFFAKILRSKIVAYPILAIWLFLVGLNLFQTEQYVVGKLHWDGTTRETYWKSFLNNYPKEDLFIKSKSPDAEKALQGESGI